MTTFYRCDGTISAEPSGGLQCSAGWVQVDEPVYTLLSAEQVNGLLVAILSLWAVVFLAKQIAKAINL